VKGGTSLIDVTAGVSPGEVRGRIEEALWRLGEPIARRVTVDVSDSKVVLLGRVSSREERDAAEEAVRQVEGVEQVENYLVVLP
jgi:osmotically-inducible protein OsmY